MNKLFFDTDTRTADKLYNRARELAGDTNVGSSSDMVGGAAKGSLELRGPKAKKAGEQLRREFPEMNSPGTYDSAAGRWYVEQTMKRHAQQPRTTANEHIRASAYNELFAHYRGIADQAERYGELEKADRYRRPPSDEDVTAYINSKYNK